MLPQDESRSRQAADLEKRIERLERQERNSASGQAVSAYLMLHRLRAFWPLSSRDNTGLAYDLSGQDRHLTPINGPPATVTGLVSVVGFDGINESLERADETGLDLPGALSIGAWVNFDNEASAIESILGKRGVSGQLSYFLRRDATGEIRMTVSSDGTATASVGTNGIAGAGQWYFVVGRYRSGAQSLQVTLASTGIFEQADLTTGVPASIFNSTAAFRIGAGATTTTENMTGRLAFPFLIASGPNPNVFSNLFQVTRPLFSV